LKSPFILSSSSRHGICVLDCPEDGEDTNVGEEHEFEVEVHALKASESNVDARFWIVAAAVWPWFWLCP
jgi:hypothetical protein